MRTRLAESAAAVRGVLGNPALRRLELALASLVVGQWSYTVAVAVYAYQEGGPAAVGLVGLIRMLPSAFAAPVTAFLADRFPRRRVLLVAALTEGLGVGVTAFAVAAAAPSLLVYAITAVVQISTTAAVPTRAALMPSLARDPAELTAANVVATTIDSVGSFAGPAIGGLLLVFADVGTVLALSAVPFAVAVTLMSRIPAPPAAPRSEAASIGGEVLAGFRAIGTDRGLAVVTGLYSAQTLVAGALNVLVVVAALELLDLGEAGVGYLNAAIGIGGVIGTGVALALVGRRRLASDFALGMLLWGVPMMLVAAWTNPTFALVVLAVLGVGNTLVDVSGVTLLQRSVPDAVLARVFGVLESLTWATIGLGAILASGLVAGLGARGALLAVGAILPVLTALAWRRLAAIDAEGVAPPGIEALRGVPFLASLPAATLEGLAAALRTVRFPAGAEVFRRGEVGDSFYVVTGGRVEVETGVVLGPGDFFGEIALLREVPRTATVRASTDVEAYALGREAFIAAVTGHAASASAAEAVVAARLGAPLLTSIRRAV